MSTIRVDSRHHIHLVWGYDASCKMFPTVTQASGFCLNWSELSVFGWGNAKVEPMGGHGSLLQ